MADRETNPGDPPQADRYVHDKSGGVLMRCPACHQSRYVSEYIVFVRKEPQKCPNCSSVMDPVPDDGGESTANRLRPRSSDRP